MRREIRVPGLRRPDVPVGRPIQFPKSKRLEGWKALADHLGRTVRTVQRWEREQRLPVHRQVHNSAGSIYAYAHELDAWRTARCPDDTTALDTIPGFKRRREPAPEPATPYSVAIVPMLDLSADKDQAPLCDGIMEELVTALARVPGLRVPSRSAVYAAAASGLDPSQIGRALTVSSVLEGSVRKVGPRIRVAVRLVSTDRGDLLWSGSFNGQISEVFEIQEGIARQVLQHVTSTMPPTGALTRPHTKSMEAYTCYLQSRYHWNSRTIHGLREAIDLAERAIRLDPSYAEAHAALANACIALSSYGATFPQPLVEAARNSAMTALRLNPTLSEAHSVAGIASLWSDWNTDEADKQFAMALSLNNRDATAHHWYSFSKLASGDLDGALRLSSQATLLEPQSLVIQAQVGWTLYFMRRFDDAVAHLKQLTRIDPGFWRPHTNLLWCYLQTEEYGKGVEAGETAVSLNRCTATETMLAAAYASSGRVVEARQLLHGVCASTQYASQYWVAYAYMMLDDQASAFDCLSRAIEERDWFCLLLKEEPAFERLKKEDGWRELVNRIRPVKRQFRPR